MIETRQPAECTCGHEFSPCPRWFHLHGCDFKASSSCAARYNPYEDCVACHKCHDDLPDLEPGEGLMY